MSREYTHRDREVQTYIEKFRMHAFLNDRLLSALRLFRFPRHASIFIAQAQPTFLYFLVKGQLQCTHFHMNGKPAVIALSDPITAIGDLEIMNNVPVYSNVIATRPVELLGISADTVNRFGSEDPQFLRFLVDELRRKLYKTNVIQATQVLPVIARLATYMLALVAEPAGPTETTGRIDAAVGTRARELSLPDKESLASMLGTTPRHLNRVLNELANIGAIGDNYPNIRILNRELLQEVVDR